MAELNKLMIIEESVLLAMATNPNFVSEFGFLKALQQIKKTRAGCGKCNKSASKRIQLVNAAKQSLTSMGAEKKKRLKVMLKAEKVRIRLSSGGTVKEYTF